MNNDNNNKENIEQKKINKQKLWNFNKTYKSHSYLKVIFSMFVSCLFLFCIDVNSVSANDTNLIQGNVNLNQQTSKKLYEGHFVKLPKLNEGYLRHTSTLLPNGSVLITMNKNVLIFDPKYNKFTESTKKQHISSFSRTPEALLMADNNV